MEHIETRQGALEQSQLEILTRHDGYSNETKLYKGQLSLKG